ncbi:16801_t:CDS:2, partial [Acaulospora morrowiae]
YGDNQRNNEGIIIVKRNLCGAVRFNLDGQDVGYAVAVDGAMPKSLGYGIFELDANHSALMKFPQPPYGFGMDLESSSNRKYSQMCLTFFPMFPSHFVLSFRNQGLSESDVASSNGTS